MPAKERKGLNRPLEPSQQETSMQETVYERGLNQEEMEYKFG